MACPHGERFRCRHCDGFESEHQTPAAPPPPPMELPGSPPGSVPYRSHAWVGPSGLLYCHANCRPPIGSSYVALPQREWHCIICGTKYTTILAPPKTTPAGLRGYVPPTRPLVSFHVANRTTKLYEGDFVVLNSDGNVEKFDPNTHTDSQVVGTAVSWDYDIETLKVDLWR